MDPVGNCTVFSTWFWNSQPSRSPLLSPLMRRMPRSTVTLMSSGLMPGAASVTWYLLSVSRRPSDCSGSISWTSDPSMEDGQSIMRKSSCDGRSTSSRKGDVQGDIHRSGRDRERRRARAMAVDGRRILDVSPRPSRSVGPRPASPPSAAARPTPTASRDLCNSTHRLHILRLYYRTHRSL